MNLYEHTGHLVVRKSDATSANHFRELLKNPTYYPVKAHVNLHWDAGCPTVFEAIYYDPDAKMDKLVRVTCPGFGRFEGKCEEDPGSKISKRLCLRCGNLWLDEEDKELEVLQERGGYEE